MVRPKSEELKKHTLNLREGDMEKLELLFPQLRPSVILRKIVSRFVDNAMSAAESTSLPVNNLDLDL